MNMDKSNVRMDKGCMQKNIKIKRNCLSYMGSVCTLTCIVLTTGCPVVPHFPHFQNFVHILKKFSHFPHFWENPL